MKTSCWISSILAVISVSGLGSVSAADPAPASVACTVQHAKYGALSGELRFSLTPGKESVVVQGPAATLLILEVENIGTTEALALITVRAQMNSIRFLESRENFVGRQNGLDGFGSKTLANKAKPINFQLVTSTGRPGLINVDCRLDQRTRLPAHASDALRVARGDAQEVNFSQTEE